MRNFNAPPALVWERTERGSYEATDADGVKWGILRHPTPEGRWGKGGPDGKEYWWLHRATADGEYRFGREELDNCPIVTHNSNLSALHRHPKVLRYASVLAAGWDNWCWRIQNGTPSGDEVMRRGEEYSPLSALMGDPVMVHPQLLLDAVLQRDEFERRFYAVAQQGPARTTKRVMARLRDLVTDLRVRDEELLALRDKARDHNRSLGHERSAHEVRRVADALDTILGSDAGSDEAAGGAQ